MEQNRDFKNKPTNGAGELNFYMRTVKLNLCLTPRTKTKSKCIKDLSIMLKSTKTLEKNRGKACGLQME